MGECLRTWEEGYDAGKVNGRVLGREYAIYAQKGEGSQGERNEVETGDMEECKFRGRALLREGRKWAGLDKS